MALVLYMLNLITKFNMQGYFLELYFLKSSLFGRENKNPKACEFNKDVLLIVVLVAPESFLEPYNSVFYFCSVL